jgi:hypothetical protein
MQISANTDGMQLNNVKRFIHIKLLNNIKFKKQEENISKIQINHAASPKTPITENIQ